MKVFNYAGLSALVMALVLSGCTTPREKDTRQLDEKQVNELAALGARDFGIKWEGPMVGAGEHGVMAVTDGVTTLTTRAGARIFIIHNRKQFPPSDQVAYEGTDVEFKAIGTKLLQAAGANKDEIADEQKDRLDEAVKMLIVKENVCLQKIRDIVLLGQSSNDNIHCKWAPPENLGRSQ